jgi:hypothetical protein
MATKVGVGYSENPKSYDASIEATKAAMADTGIDKVDLAIMYSTSQHDPVHLRDGVRSEIGPDARVPPS